MSVVTVLWSMIAATCLTLAAVHLPVWWRYREARATLAFSIAACSAGVLAIFELVQLKATTIEVLAEAHRWSHVPIALLVVSIAAFTYHYLGAGRLWLAYVAIGLRALALVLNFTTGASVNLQAVTALRHVDLLGESVSIAIGSVNPWQAIGQLGLLALMLFVADATVTAWRRGRGPEAVAVGISLVFLIVAGLIQAILLFWGLVTAPSTVSVFALGYVVVMGYALSGDLLRARRLAVELHERELDVTLVADAANLGLWARDLASGTLSASPKWRELFGLADHERLTFEQVVQRIHPDDRAEFEARLNQAVAECGEYHAEFRVLLPSGGMRWISSTSRVECDARGQPIRTRGVSIDATLRKQAEQEMLQLRQDMAHVGRVSMLGQLAGTLAHEINQPLSAILRNAEAAALFLQERTPDVAEVRAILDDIRKDDQRAGEVIDRMRGLLRRQPVTSTRLDLAQVLRDVTTLLRPDAVVRHVTLEMAVPAGLPDVLGDRVQIQQVLLNLIMNGMDAIDGARGRGDLVRVSVRHDQPGTIEVSVFDTGSGIPAEQLGTIFDPFFTTKPKGIGIGLSISRGIIEAHAGRIWAENVEGGGAKFSFALPVAP